MSPRSVSRYQRRILAWGAALACLLFVVGAPIYLDNVESDLTERVSAELGAAGFDGVTVSFSGQTGSIRCRAPLGDPRAALDVAYGVRGVRSIEDLPDECRVLTAAPDTGDDTGVPDDSGDVVEPDDTEAAATTTTLPDEVASTTTTVAEPDFDSVLDVLGGNPQFSLLRQLVQDAGLTAELSAGGPMTLFAPTDAAFDALPADTVAQLRSDPDTLDRVLRHHVVGERLLAAELTDGPLTTAAGDQITVDVSAPSPRVDGASIVEPDVLAANGVVHAIDELLLPDDVDLTTPDPFAPVSATFGDGRYLLEGIVRSEVERTILVSAASEAVGTGETVDELTVDPDRGIGEDVAQRLASLVAALPVHLVSGTAGFDGDMLVVEGAYVDDAGRGAIEEIAAAVEAEISLTQSQPVSAEDTAAALEDELNALVAERPILFEPSSAILDDSAQPILDEVARRAEGVTGLTIVVVGHTDSDGDPSANLDLSRQRAVVVLQELAGRGLDPGSLESEGFGSERPILVDGVEDKDASRRVEFRVEVA